MKGMYSNKQNNKTVQKYVNAKISIQDILKIRWKIESMKTPICRKRLNKNAVSDKEIEYIKALEHIGLYIDNIVKKEMN